MNCDLSDQGLILSHPNKDAQNSVILRHPPFCPMLHLSQAQKSQISSDQKLKNAGISVAVAVILESLDNKVLLTRRPPHMRTFPNVWVPPGGGSEESESIIDTGLREIQEETGLKIHEVMIFANPLCLWESVYPPLLAKGDPKRHQLVVYLHILVKKTHKELDLEILLDPQETDAYMWLDLDQVQVATNYSVPLDQHAQVLVKELKNGDLVDVFKSYGVFRADVPTSGTFDVERISTGTRFALEQYFEKKGSTSRL